MKKLILMVGAPASGKTTWIKDNRLEDYTLSADSLRVQLGGYKYVVGQRGLEKAINSKNETVVWNMLKEQVETRMKNGQTIVIDNTNLSKGVFKPWNDLRRKYDYEVYGVDCMQPKIDFIKSEFPDASKQEIKEKVIGLIKSFNKSRVQDVPDSVIERFANRYFDWKRSNNFPSWIKMINADDIDSLDQITNLEYLPDMERFDRIQVIGDVHADYDALMKVFESHKKGTAYVFVGDYLDRGTKTIETFEYLTHTLVGAANCFFAFGNHEDGWEKWYQNREKHGQFAVLSLPKLLDKYGEKKLDKRIHNFIKLTKDYFAFKYFGNTYFVSHAGFEPEFLKMDIGLLPRNGFIYGIGAKGVNDRNAPYNRDIDEVWHNTMPKNMINLHGHRNNFNRFCEENSYNLTADGKFRWLTITKDGIEPHEIDRIDTPTFGQELEQEFHIKQHELPDGIKANNFDKEAFNKNIWNRLTIRSRGLFTRGDEIVGRGFNKFFNVGQMEDSTLDSLEYPVVVEKKHNGFLGVVFYDNEKEKVDVYSKGGNEYYSRVAKDTLKETGWYEKVKDYYNDEANRDTTILFEIVDPSVDNHPIKYHHKHTFPLAIISNDISGKVLNLDPKDPHFQNKVFAKLAKDIYNINVYGVARNTEELEFLITSYKAKYPTREGMVLYGQNKMLKIKLPYYLKAKELRATIKYGSKKHWYYGAENWFKLCKKHGIKEFNSNLPLILWKYEDYKDSVALDDLLDKYANSLGKKTLN